MTINDKISAALLPFAGKSLTRQQIELVTVQKFPELKGHESSFNIADHVASAGQATQYADRNLSKSGTGYMVLPRAQWAMKPATTGKRSVVRVNDADALAQANALLQGSKTPVAGIVVTTDKVNGEVKAQA